MGIFERNDGKGIERLFLELADSHKDALVYKWPDHEIRRHSRVHVDIDYVAVFVSQGRVIGALQPGFHELWQAGESPVYGFLLDHLTRDGAYDTELFFVTTRDKVGVRFGGPLDQVRDPESGLVFGLRVFGDAAARVVDPVAFISKLVGTDGVEDEHVVLGWVSSQILAAVREEAVAIVAEHGVLTLGTVQDRMEAAVLPKANATLAAWGLAVGSFGQLQVNVDDADAERLKRLAEAQTYVQMAGSYEAYARGEALRNLGHGGAADPVLAAMLLGGLGGQQQPAPQQPQPAAPAGHGFCPSCGTALPAAAAFCPGCGAPQQH